MLRRGARKADRFPARSPVSGYEQARAPTPRRPGRLFCISPSNPITLSVPARQGIRWMCSMWGILASCEAPPYAVVMLRAGRRSRHLSMVKGSDWVRHVQPDVSVLSSIEARAAQQVRIDPAWVRARGVGAIRRSEYPELIEADPRVLHGRGRPLMLDRGGAPACKRHVVAPGPATIPARECARGDGDESVRENRAAHDQASTRDGPSRWVVLVRVGSHTGHV